jgi:transmembrane sensor
MDRNFVDDLLARYLKQETSVEENRVVEKWLEENRNGVSPWQTLDPVSKDLWLSNVLSEINISIKTDKTKTSPIPLQEVGWYKFAAVAAVLLVCLGLYIWLPQLSQNLNDTELITASIPNNQTKKITLSDGTKVWLNAGSELRFPDDFKGDTRTVHLSGEAYFDVQHDETKPFLIYTGKVLTTVLGTAFNIKEDRKKRTLEVTVSRGKVSVADGGKLLSVLTQNKQLSLDLVSRKTVEKTLEAEAVVSWVLTEMRFDDITLASAAKQIEQQFNVKIGFSNERLKDCRFSGAIIKADQLDKILDVITRFNNATWQRKPNGQIIISGNGCN